MSAQEFTGEQYRLSIEPRYGNGRHAMIVLRYRRPTDDGDKPLIVTSGYWASDLIDLLTTAQRWMEENCDPDIVGNDGQYGWKFRDGSVITENQRAAEIAALEKRLAELKGQA